MKLGSDGAGSEHDDDDDDDDDDESGDDGVVDEDDGDDNDDDVMMTRLWTTMQIMIFVLVMITTAYCTVLTYCEYKTTSTMTATIKPLVPTPGQETHRGGLPNSAQFPPATASRQPTPNASVAHTLTHATLCNVLTHNDARHSV